MKYLLALSIILSLAFTPLAAEEAAEQIESKELELVVSYANSLFSEDCNQFKDAFSYVQFNKKYQIDDHLIYE